MCAPVSLAGRNGHYSHTVYTEDSVLKKLHGGQGGKGME
jgi:hypothetical protein